MSSATVRKARLESLRECKKMAEIFGWSAKVLERQLLQHYQTTDSPTTPEGQELLARAKLEQIEGRDPTPEEQEVLTQLELARAEGVHAKGVPGEFQELRFNTAWDLYVKLRKADGGKPC
jgi:hypothetical protein